MASLHYLDQSVFASLSARYTESKDAESNRHRIYVSVSGGPGQSRILLALDTGADYSFLSREIAMAWQVRDIDPFDPTKPRRYLVRGHRLDCDQGTVDVRLSADGSQSLECSISVWFPAATESVADVNFGVLGYRGCLDRLCFAISPNEQLWFFGLAA